MISLTVIKFVFLVSFLIVLGKAADAADKPQQCGGANLMAAIERDDPQAFAAMRAEAETIANGHARFWRVSKSGIAHSWLLGTMHVSDPRVTELPMAVRVSFETADTVVIENTDVLDPGGLQAKMMSMLHYTMLLDGSTLSERLPERLHGEFRRETLARGVPFEVADRMQPWLISTTLALPVCELSRKRGGSKVLDQVLGNQALARGKQVIGLESLEDQFSAMASLPESLHIDALTQTLSNKNYAEDMIETMVQLYLEGNTAYMLPLMRALVPENQTLTDYGKFQEIMIDMRNQTMLDGALPHLAKGNTFVAVGALHLTGKVGLVALLRQAGFDLEPVL